MTIQSKVQFLSQFVKIPPEMWDYIFPHGPVLKSQAIKEYIMAGVLRDISHQIHNKQIAREVRAAGAEMVKYAADNLVNSWEDGDDLCPLWPPFPFPHIHFGPRPEPWLDHNIAALNPQPEPPGFALKLISDFTSLPNVSEQLKNLGAKMEYNMDAINEYK